MSYTLYILRCADNTLYTGITTDVVRRLVEHNSSNLGAKYTHSRRPCILVHSEGWYTHSEALKREIAIKKMKRGEKQKLIQKQ